VTDHDFSAVDRTDIGCDVKAYLVLDFAINDFAGFRDYIAAIPTHIARHDGCYIVRGAKPSCIEGDWRPQHMVIIEFPGRSRAEAFLRDPHIQDLFKVRHQTTTSKLVLVDGCL
jgi:uncharacterized protein (DUF1330 family)